MDIDFISTPHAASRRSDTVEDVLNVDIAVATDTTRRLTPEEQQGVLRILEAPPRAPSAEARAAVARYRRTVRVRR